MKIINKKRIIALILAVVLLAAIPLMAASAISVDDDYDIYANEREPENPSKTCQPGQHTWGKPCDILCNGKKIFCVTVNWICLNSCSATIYNLFGYGQDPIQHFYDYNYTAMTGHYYCYTCGHESNNGCGY